MENVLIIGAFDRYNYGDLLFPLIIEKQLKTYGQEFNFRFFGLVESDLSMVGGKPTEDLSAFYAACNAPSGRNHIIVAGGEALGVTWHSLFAALNPTYQKIHRYRYRLSKLIDLNAMAKRFLNGATALPFVFTKKDFGNVQSVVLNSLGGSGLNKEIFEKYAFMQEKISRVDYLAVRDRLTVGNLSENGVSAELFPDSAVLMSRFYPSSYLQKKVTPAVCDYVEAEKGDYLFFQINRKNTQGLEANIAEQLDKIAQHTDTKLCLCPIGKALDHDDHVALAEVRKHLKSAHTYFDADNIWDIMYLIANARCYVGTSLHGAITAMSYAVPYVGLKVEKLNAYLSTWGVEGNTFAVDFDRLFEQFKVATAIDKERYSQKQEEQIGQIKKAFDQMARVILGSQVRR
ncbi:polysaccharide pyruvyl transferase family protein [Echinicola strongylocentroti]|uniref:Polysaccharide pyruvyl transferase family protein n=1 Tax=Echinicola strongylocentroti TaxID=1795355 RepID=A0A2Z4IG19_9BACT|nr:polysaccharide pyruvyl transferase family protein [Echinicola strongylocentroti]AWW29637.1 polysaccharide pyruvyl transferase family protein [Echinicola strongylocentroti]